MTNYLGLDLALRTGWARVVGGRVYESGVIDLRAARGSGHNGYAFEALYRWLVEQTRLGDQIAYELALHRGGRSTRMACGLQAVVQMHCAVRGLPTPIAVHVSTLKKHATGIGRASKAAMMAYAARLLGRRPIDDNEADAVAVAMWAWTQGEGRSGAVSDCMAVVGRETGGVRHG